MAQGRINPDGRFAAAEGLAKHDENYMPAEAFSGVWHLGKPVDGSRGWSIAGIQRS